MATGTTEVHGGAAAAARPRAATAREIAQGGLHDVSDLAVFGGAIACGALLGDIGYREGNLAVRGGNMALRGAEMLARNGNTPLAPPTKAAGNNDDLARREAELTAELEALRERRSA